MLADSPAFFCAAATASCAFVTASLTDVDAFVAAEDCQPVMTSKSLLKERAEKQQGALPPSGYPAQQGLPMGQQGGPGTPPPAQNPAPGMPGMPSGMPPGMPPSSYPGAR